jgi:hypothetical protein
MQGKIPILCIFTIVLRPFTHEKSPLAPGFRFCIRPAIFRFLFEIPGG